MVEEIEDLTAKLQLRLLSKIEGFIRREIEVCDASRSQIGVYPRLIAEGEWTWLSEARSIEPMLLPCKTIARYVL